ncbi:MAG: hypothetical protein GVY13_11460 [Alphaproteobacteria bacterium]|nr:hypothetical protein [Alphaproteobacteria bacterium]
MVSGFDESDRQKIENSAFRLIEAARPVEKKIMSELYDNEDVLSSALSMKSRIKERRSILRKVLKKRAEGMSDFQPEHLNDILGIRIVTYFQSGVTKTVNEILKMVKHESQYRSPFIKDLLIESVIYTSRPENDPLSITESVRKVILDAGLSNVPRIEGKETQYSSVHLILGCKSKIEKEENSDEDFVFPFEIQVRSTLEEAWGEIDHRLRYSISRGSASNITWNKHLNALKAMMDGCIQYVEVIHEQAAETSGLLVQESQAKRSAEAPIDALSELVEAPTEVTTAFKKIYTIIEEAKSTKLEPLAQDLFKKSATELRVLISDKKDYLYQNEDAARKASYWLRMERAFCLLNTGESNDLVKAEQIYEEIQKDYPNDSVSRYRHGYILRRRESYDEALSALFEAKEILDNENDRRITGDHWIRAALRRTIGYTYWRKSSKCGVTNAGRSERRKLLQDAISWTREAFKIAGDEQERIACINNLVYYGWEERQGSNANTEFHVLDTEMGNWIHELAEFTSRQPDHRYTRYDTLCRGYLSVGDVAKARRVAEHVVDLLKEVGLIRQHVPREEVDSVQMDDFLRGTIAHSLDGDERDAFVFADRLLARPVVG